MRNRNFLRPRAAVAPRALRGPGLWLLGMCVALGACAEPAPAGAATAAVTPADAANPRAPAVATPQDAAATPPAAAPQPAATAAGHADRVVAPGAPTASADARPAASTAVVDASLPRVQVHKSPTCGCCSLWVDHMREAGFAVEVHDTQDLAAVKSRFGVPLDAQSCHTAEVGGLVVEGHVPASDIKRALAQGGTRALVLPGMPVGSPGMEVPGVDAPPYTVERITSDGTREPFATHGE